MPSRECRALTSAAGLTGGTTVLVPSMIDRESPTSVTTQAIASTMTLLKFSPWEDEDVDTSSAAVIRRTSLLAPSR